MVMCSMVHHFLRLVLIYETESESRLVNDIDDYMQEYCRQTNRQKDECQTDSETYTISTCNDLDAQVPSVLIMKSHASLDSRAQIFSLCTHAHISRIRE